MKHAAIRWNFAVIQAFLKLITKRILVTLKKDSDRRVVEAKVDRSKEATTELLLWKGQWPVFNQALLEPYSSAGWHYTDFIENQRISILYSTHLTVAPFTLVFGCSFSMPIPRLRLSVNLSEAARGEISLLILPWYYRDGSAPYYWWTKTASTDKPVAWSGRCVDPTSVNYTGPSLNLIQRNVPQSNVTWSNNSNVVTVTVTVWQLVWGKKYSRYMWRSVRPPACPTDSSLHFCPENRLCPCKWVRLTGGTLGKHTDVIIMMRTAMPI